MRANATWTRRRLSILLLAALIASVPGASDVVAKTPANDAAEELLYPEYHGPKKTIAVSSFDAVGAFVAQYGGWDIGGGVAAMLVSELQKTNRFIVVDRSDLDVLLREKQLALTGVARNSGAETQLLGVQTFIRGSVTEFSQRDKGGGVNLGVGIGGFGGGAGRRTATGKTAIDIRLINAANGAVTATHTVSKEIKSKSFALQGGKGGISIGTDKFDQTSLGQAVREAIREAVGRIIADMETVPWEGMIARVDGDRVYINAGSNANVPMGATLLCIRTINEITDPATGEVLGAEQATLGEVVVETVEERYSIGRYLGSYPPKRGDAVRMKSAYGIEQ